MPSPRTIGIGFTLACADQEKIEWRLVSETISAADMVSGTMSVVVMVGSSYLPWSGAENPRSIGPGQPPARGGDLDRRVGDVGRLQRQPAQASTAPRSRLGVVGCASVFKVAATGGG